MKKRILPIVVSLICLGLAVVVLKYVVLKKSATHKWQQKITSSTANNAFLNQYLAKSFVKQQSMPHEFIECFSSISPIVRKNALIVLQSLGEDFADQNIIDEILYITLEDSDSTVRREAALALMSRQNIRIKTVKRAYNLEKDKEIQCYLGGMIALSLEVRDIHVLNDHLQNSHPQHMRTVLSSYITYHSNLWKSLSPGILAAVVAEIAPVIESSPLKKEITSFLHNITHVDLPPNKEQWFSWVRSVYDNDIASLDNKQLNDLFFSSEITNAKKLSIAKKIGIYPKNIPVFLDEILQSNGQLHYVFSHIDEQYYGDFVAFIHLHHTNSRYLVDFLLDKNTTFSNDFLIENMDSLVEEERDILLRQIQKNPDKSSYEVTIFGDGKQIQILKSSNNIVNTHTQPHTQQLTKNNTQKKPLTQNNKQIVNNKPQKQNIAKPQFPYQPQQLITLKSNTEKGSINIPMVYELQAKAMADIGEVKITVVIPKTVTYLRSQPLAEVNGQKLTWQYDVIAQGKNKNIRVWLMPTTSGEQSFFSFAKAIPVTRNSVTIGAPQLQTTITGPQQQDLATSFSYELRIKNTGDGEAHEVVASIAMPDGFSHESGEQNLVFPIGVIKVGEEKIIHTKVTGSLPGKQCSQIKITSANHPAITEDFCCQIQKRDFSISIENIAQCSVKEQALVNVTLVNTGNKDLEDLKIHANFPTNSRIISHDISQAQINANSISGIQNMIPVGEQATFSILIASTQIGEQCFTIEAQYQQKKHQATSCITWQQAPKLRVIHRGPPQITVGEEFVSEIIVQNIGEVVAKDIVVTLLAPQLQYEQVLLNINELTIKGEKHFAIKGKARQEGDAKSIARIECKGADINEDCVVFFVNK